MHMFKILFLLFIGILLAALTQARPSYLHTPVAVPAARSFARIEYTPTLVGHAVHSLPTAVSHQSQTIVHEKRPFLRPIIEHTPIVRSYTAPILRSYATPTRVALHPKSYTTPILQTYAPSIQASGAVASVAAWPLTYAGAVDPLWNAAFETPTVYEYSNLNDWPLKK